MKLIKDKYKKKNYIKLNKNNTGSTLIIVLIMTSFVLILASSISSIVMLNLRMKKTKLNSKTVFYNSEEAVDEIYLTVSKLAMEKVKVEFRFHFYLCCYLVARWMYFSILVVEIYLIRIRIMIIQLLIFILEKILPLDY